MKGRRAVAVVAGGAGFVGSHLCERLLLDGFEVLCVDNFLTGSPANIEHLNELGPCTLVEADIVEGADIAGPVDVVLHLASPASPVDYLRLPTQTLKIGAIGTLNLLELAREKRARFVLASTSEVYGDPGVHPQHEGYWGNVNPIGPRSVYDESKRYAEALTAAYHREYAVDIGIVRIFNTYGPRMRPHDGRAIPTFIWQAINGQPLTVAGDGQQTRSVCYIDDLVDGLVRMIAAPVVGPINLGNPEEISMLDLAARIQAMVGSTLPIEFIGRPVDDPSIRCPDIALARRALGWTPMISLADGLKLTIDWFHRLRKVTADGDATPDHMGAPRARRSAR